MAARPSTTVSVPVTGAVTRAIPVTQAPIVAMAASIPSQPIEMPSKTNTSPDAVRTLYASKSPEPSPIRTMVESQAPSQPVQDKANEPNPANKESSTVPTFATQDIQNTQAPSSEAVRTVYASQKPVTTISTTIPSSTPEPSAVITKVPSSVPSMSISRPIEQPLRILPGPENVSVGPLPLPVTDGGKPAQASSFDYKTAGLIALAAVVVLGGLAMWSGQSKGKTQRVAANRRRRSR